MECWEDKTCRMHRFLFHNSVQDVISGVIPCTPNRPWKCLQCHFNVQDGRCKIIPCTARMKGRLDASNRVTFIQSKLECFQ